MLPQRYRELVQQWHHMLAAIGTAFDFILFDLLQWVYPVFEKKSIKHILLLRYDALSDLIYTLPALTALREQYPQAKIDIVVRSAVQELVEYHPVIDNVIIFDNNWCEARRNDTIIIKVMYFLLSLQNDFFFLVKLLKKNKYNLMIDFTQKRRNILLAIILGIPHRHGYAIPGGSFLLTKRVVFKQTQQVVKNNLALVGASAKTIPAIVFSLKRQKKLTTKIKHGKHQIIAMHMGTGKKHAKSWPLENYADLLLMLQKKCKPEFILLGTKDETDLGELLLREVQEKTKQRIKFYNLLGKTTITELIYLADRIDLLIAPDAGPLHLYAALGVPVLGLYGSSSKVLWEPIGKHVQVIQKKQLILRNIFDNRAMKAITPGEVYQTAIRMLKEKRQLL